MAQPALNIESEFNAAQHMLNQGRLDDAEKVLTRLKAIMAPHPLLFEYLGFIALQRQDLKKAVRHYRKAVKLDPASSHLKIKLAEVLVSSGDETEAIQIAQNVHRKDPKNVSVLNLLGTFAAKAGTHDDARAFFSAATDSDPNCFQSWHNLGRFLLNQGESKDAVDALVKADTIHPGHFKTLIYLGCSYTALGQLDLSLSALTNAQSLAASPAQFCEAGIYIVEAHIRAQDLEKALQVIADIETRQPGDPRTQSLRASVFREQGRFEEALAIIEVLRQDPSVVEEKWFPNDLEAQCLQSLSRHQEAANAFEAANQRKAKVFARNGMDKAVFIQHAAEALAIYEDTQTASWPDLSSSSHGEDLHFINGFPRSGTTLIDAVLRTHTKLAIAEESNAANHTWLAAKSLSPKTRLNLEDLDEAATQKLREHYFESLQEDLSAERAGRKTVDRHATGLLQAGLMKRIFPNAQFFMMLRHPCDVVLSAWSTNFQLTNHTANYLTLEDTARLYNQLMTIHTTLEDKVGITAATIRYEDLVTDLRGTVKPILELMGVDWEDQMEQFHQSKHRPNKTASFNQISKPLYKTAVYRFEHYRDTLKPVMPILEPWIERFGY